MSEQKLSELMKQGAAVLEPYQHAYFDNTAIPHSACALGCAMWSVDTNRIDYLIREIGIDMYTIWFEWKAVPVDLQEAIEEHRGLDDDFSGRLHYSLHLIISAANDLISRERAIEITEMLGY